MCGPKWTQVEPRGPKWTQVDQSGPKWTQVDQSGSRWTQVDPSGPKGCQVDPSGSKWYQVEQSGAKLSWVCNVSTKVLFLIFGFKKIIWGSMIAHKNHNILKPFFLDTIINNYQFRYSSRRQKGLTFDGISLWKWEGALFQFQEFWLVSFWLGDAFWAPKN